MNLSRTACAILLLFLFAVCGISKGGTFDIYALIEKVVLEPNDAAPERMQIWGAFAFAPPGNWKPQNEPRRGYFYFRLPSSEKVARAARSEWAELQALSGSGQAVEFGRIDELYYGMLAPNQTERDYIDANGHVFYGAGVNLEESMRIRKDSAPPRDPVTYPMPVGVIQLGNSDNFGLLLTHLKDALTRCC